MTLQDSSESKNRDCPVTITEVWLVPNFQENVFKVTVRVNLVALFFHFVI